VLIAKFFQGRRSQPTPSSDAGDHKIPARRLLLHTAIAAFAGLLVLLPLFVYLHHAFGSPFTTGYGLSGEAAAFSLQHFVAHAPYALKALSQFPLGLSLLFPLALAGMLYALWREPRLGLLFVLTTLPTLALYSAYYWFIADPTPWWQPVSYESLIYLRFFLGIFPMLTIAGLWFLDRLLHRAATAQDTITPARVLLAAVLLVLGIMNLVYFPRWGKFVGTAARDLAAMELVSRHLPPDAVIVPDGYSAYSLIYETDMTVYYPRYFNATWVSQHLAPGTATRPADYDPLRRGRFAAALESADRTDLFSLLESRLVEHARAGRTVWILYETSSPRWYAPLERAFTLTPVDGNRDFGIVLFQLRLREAPPATRAN
jgi:hypothetical protein